ncbi:pyridoxal phosphate-dependent transferase [Vararia minispora EC-137]|uniref:Pyridoxal phosphate-dependent transferase n=1 Tax=Vararia minispora EC-137 TaxID=1314806 RepID=A0ACB8QHH6_9AGAM|nr:pyridoxal phosphate-dependent transferase [Vararia minispora EC-137]
MDIEEFRKAGYDAIDRICEYYYSLREYPVVPQVQPGFLKKALPNTAPGAGEPWSNIVDDYTKLILPGLLHFQHPLNFSYFPIQSTFAGTLGDLLAGSAPTPSLSWFVGPASTELENVVMDWAAKMLGLDRVFHVESNIGGGVIQTSASESMLVSVVAARTRYLLAHPMTPIESLLIYVTSQTHSCGRKAGLVLGLNVRVLDVDEPTRVGGGLDAETLRVALDEDHAAGLAPFVLITTVGTTTSGAVDNVADVGALLKTSYPDVWMHVDAAWAGVVLACPEYRERAQLAGINAYADSFCTNFHKWGLVNFECSALWVRDRQRLIEALEYTPPYLRTKQGDAGDTVEYRNWHLGLCRRFRSLKMWFVLRSYGLNGFQGYIRNCIAMNHMFAKQVCATPSFELVSPPSFALTVFRIVPRAGAPNGTANKLNRVFYDALLARSSEVLLTQTELGGVFCVRFCVGSSRTTPADVEDAWNIVCEVGETVRARFGKGLPN